LSASDAAIMTTRATTAMIGTPTTRAVAIARSVGAIVKPGIARLASSDAVART
jgi:hypothetical protein